MLKLFKLLSNKRLFILLITLVLFIVVMGFSLATRKGLSWPENFLRDSTGFVQKMFYKPAGYVAGLFEDIGNLSDLAKENEQLKIMVTSMHVIKPSIILLKHRMKTWKKMAIH